jgi:hypothetical protein
MDEAEWKAKIEEGFLLRGWISNSYAQIEFLLGDLIIRCREFPQYAEYTKTVSLNAKTRVAKVRKILKIDGPLTPFKREIENMLNTFESNSDIRNLLAHGFCIFYHTPDGDAVFHFRKFDRPPAGSDDDHVLIEHRFRLIDLQYHKAKLVDQAQHALGVFMGIHASQGWI